MLFSVKIVHVVCAISIGNYITSIIILQPPRKELSNEMKAKLRNEYYGLGGSPNTTMGGNYFLYIILAISILAIMSSALGYL